MVRDRGTSSSGEWDVRSSSGAHQVKRRRLTGDLDVGTAHRALELLADNSLYGSFTVTDGLSDVSFFFTRGGLRVVAAGRQIPTLRARLRNQEILTTAETHKVDGAIKAIKADKTRVVKDVGILEREVLIEQLKLKPSDVDDATREVIGEVFLDCLFWESPQYEAVTGEPNMEMMQRRDLSALTLSLGVSDLVEKIQQKLRTISEIRRTVSSLSVRVEITPKGREAAESHKKLGDGPMGETRTRLVRLAAKEPGQPASDLAQRLEIGELQAASLLHELVVEGLLELRRAPPDKKAELERLRKMEEGLDQAISQLLRRVRVADDAAKTGQTDKAARHMARAGGMLLQEGRNDEASRAFTSALKHRDDDLEAREGFVQSLWTLGRGGEAMEQSEELGRRYLELNLPGRAKRVLEKALGMEERTSSLQLLVKSLVKLRQPRQATEAGERLVNRLRREGRRDEARSAAGELLALSGDPNDRARLLKALGVDRRKSVVLTVTLVASALLLAPAQAHLAKREGYVSTTREVATLLRRAAAEPTQEGDPLGKALDLVKEYQDAGGEVGEHAAGVTQQLEALEADRTLFEEQIAPYLPWEAQPDVSFVSESLERIQDDCRTPALRGPLGRLIERLKEHQTSSGQARDRVSRLPPGEEAMAAAREYRALYQNMPGELAKARVMILVKSEPPGASVEWGRIPYSASLTPLDLALPLLGTKRLKLSKDGFRDHEQEVKLDDLSEDGELTVSLTRARVVRRPTPTPTPRPRPTPTPSVRPPAPTPTPSAPPRRLARIQLFEGVFLGRVDKSKYSFAGGDELLFSRLDLPRIYRCDVKPLNDIEGGFVYLTGLRVVIQVKRRGRWMAQPAFDYEFGDRFVRGAIAQIDGHVEIQRLERSVHLEKDWLIEEAQEAIDDALYEFKRRRER